MTQAETKKTSQEMLQEHVDFIAKQIQTGEFDFEPSEEGEEPDAYDYLKDALDIEYIVNGKGEYIAARILVAFGGPNIWINTRTKQVEGAWWSTQATANYWEDAIGLDYACEELWTCR